MGSEQVTVLGFAGSLRKASYNRGLLRAAKEDASEGVAVEIFDLSDIPLYNADVEAVGIPSTVNEFHQRIIAADAILIATPEYNRSITGVLKNALDWASRPPGGPPLKHKPVALLGASPGRLGTVNAQSETSHVLAAIHAYVMPDPQVLISGAKELFDGSGNLTDIETRKRVSVAVDALVDWTHRLNNHPR